MSRKWIPILTTLTLAWMGQGHMAFAAAEETLGLLRPDAAPVPLINRIDVHHVEVPQKRLFMGQFGSWGLWNKNVSCKDGFTGTFENSDIEVSVNATGGSGRYRHTVVTTFNNSYKLSLKEGEQFQRSFHGNGEVKLHLPELADNVPYVDQTIMLITEDSAGNKATTSLTFTVSRPVILEVSEDPGMRAGNCFQRYAPYEAMTGVLSNATNNLSALQIHQGVQKLWTSTHGWQWGVFVSPLSPLCLGNLLTLDFMYFSETSKTVSETTEVVTHYDFDPGDYMQVYAQPTRYVTAYDAILVDVCGAQTRMPGAYMFQWWGFAYHVHPVNPYSTKAPALESIGAPMMNTCAPTYTQAPGVKQQSDFRRTN